ncbi:hypothetical protein B0H14DRAFT_2803694 [Mycena olivaceomarginata]|nr:hypothetical protein B0H14DRAFT_2803694 [Mycena olivaceomarginata]
MAFTGICSVGTIPRSLAFLSVADSIPTVLFPGKTRRRVGQVRERPTGLEQCVLHSRTLANTRHPSLRALVSRQLDYDVCTRTMRPDSVDTRGNWSGVCQGVGGRNVWRKKARFMDTPKIIHSIQGWLGDPRACGEMLTASKWSCRRQWVVYIRQRGWVWADISFFLLEPG